MNTDRKNNGTEQCTIPFVIGRVYGQTITGTLFKYEVLRIKEDWKKNIWCYVKNIETGHEMFIKDTDLHDLQRK